MTALEPRRRFAVFLAACLVLTMAAAALAPLVGSVRIGPGDLWRALLGEGDPVVRTIVLQSRIPRVLVAVLAGAGLAVSGAVLQAILRNPLADPFTLGVASGGALGASLVILLGGSAIGASVLGLGLQYAASMAGSLGTLLLILAAADRFGMSSGTIVLAGISVNIIVTSSILFIQYMSDIAQSHLIVRWLMGELDVWGAPPAAAMAAVVLPCVAVAVLMAGRLNHLAMGDLVAASRGIGVRRVFTVGVILASLVTGGIVAVCGPIAFVGLVVPHIVRLVAGHDNRFVIPLSAAAGALLLVVCDGVARTVVAPGEIPVGVLTSILGGTALIALLVFKRRAMGA